MTPPNVVIIPARYGSSRFPGKPLAVISGQSLIKRVWMLAKAAENVQRVIIATDDDRIAKHVKDFGGEVVMTPSECRNGTERTHFTIKNLGKEVGKIINLQGDAVLTPPWIISEVIKAMNTDTTADLATPAVRLTYSQLDKFEQSFKKGEAGGTTVTFDNKKRALYFSKSIIPFIRGEREGEWSPVYKHIGLYGYTRAGLEKYVSLPPGRLEEIEQLEQLRALENGMPIKIVEVDLRGRTMWSIDNPSDATAAEEIIKTEGELV